MRAHTPSRLPLWLSAILLIFASPLAAAPRAEKETAAKVDAALARGLPAHVRLPDLADDTTFLRRVSLDLTGKLPEPEAVRRFAADPAKDKRARIVDELLKSDAYA